MRLSVNILCWNTCDTLVKSLAVLKTELAEVEHEIIVVDNGSTDEIGEVDFTGVTYIRNKDNRGISHGKNQALDVSKGDYILLIDGDIVPTPGSLICFINFLDSNIEADAIGFYPNKFSNQVNKNGQTHYEEQCFSLHEPKPYTCHCIYYGMYRRKVFDEVRFCTDDAFGEPGYGWEDFDFHARMVRAGFSQWVAGINTAKGKYYHNINSSIRCMGGKEFRKTSMIRRDLFYKREKDVR